VQEEEREGTEISDDEIAASLNCPGKRGRAHQPSLINGAVEVGMETLSQGGPDTHVTNVSPLFQHILI